MEEEKLKEEDVATNEESKEIKPINRDTVHRICSGQVVLTLAIAMKELVENSIDAGATIIDIHLKEYGSELLEVSDNGSGVEQVNFEALTLKHYTSKLKEFSDLESLGTLGFRGEALSSLCALSDVTIITKHKSANIGTKIQYDRNGKILSQEITARQQGTTVTLKNLFSTLPVRRKEFLKNLKKEFAKLCTLLYAYCLIPNGIKFTCTNVTAQGSRSTVVATQGNKIVRDNIISVFGVRQLSNLIDVDIVVPDEAVLKEYNLDFVFADELPFYFSFLISSVVHGSGRSSADRQFYFINSRPCEPTKLMKLVNEIYRQFNNKQYPFVYLNILTKTAIVDVNITPDKRQVFIEKEKLLLATVKMSLMEVFKQFPSTFKSQNIDLSQTIRDLESKSKLNTSKRGIKRSVTEGDKKVQSILDRFQKKSKSEDSIEKIKPVKELNLSSDSDTETTKETNKIQRILNKFKSNKGTNDSDSDVEFDVDQKMKVLVNIACKLTQDDNKEKIADISKNEKCILEISVDEPLLIKPNKKEVKLKQFNTENLRDKFKKLTNTDKGNENIKVKFRTEIDPKNSQKAEEELDKFITKEDFKNMEILGQFNLGFIIVRLNDDLFLVDQHATDEKYNFEMLQKNKVIKSQVLVNPKLLELTAASKTTLTEHEDVFNKNGFTFKIDTDTQEKNIYLTSIPIGGEGYVFGKSDIDEMIFMLQEDASQNMLCRPTRVRQMFASKACRKSVMIGKSLSKSDMRKLIDHMGEIEQPWNCPHGRPTMRHLINLKLIL